MGLSLNDLAEAEIYKSNDNFVRLFKDLDKVCTAEDDKDYPCQSFEYLNVKEPFKSQLQKILTILQRNKAHDNIYLNEIASGNHNSCVYFKYWFYHKIINHNTEEINFSELNQIRSKNTMDIYHLFPPEHCKFYAKILEDVKILKMLYDHIFFFNSVDNNYNFIEKIKKCEFCKHLDNYLKQVFKNRSITCASSSSLAFCVEYNGEMLSREGGEESLPVIQSDATPQGFPQNPKDRNLPIKNIIGGMSVLGVFSVLFLLYKYTSFGHLVRSRTRWIKDTWRISQEKDNEILLLDDSETYHMNSDNTQYNVAYNTVQDY
ncbi:PIR Superfamily Protein [Plasmodium ovale curtisi]|uniref:PIR Superfamily Protein n=1 Tax=Plasmodium ovale curtisi TaxID=864141 RepID=A0A1A8W9G1_PLAOA|nr:PIR Superfamily Protein [Plasmodium ovale curtisi]